jgi:hypothetical protein
MQKFSTWRLAASLSLPLLAAFSLGVYLMVSQMSYGLGFPLDDAWIHQTYARNLTDYGEWAFIPGQASAGSTSPLWSGILAIGVVLHLAPYPWTFLLGFLALWGIGVVGQRVFERMLSPRPSTGNVAFWWVGVVLIFEWHLVWAAASGMETLLFTLLVLLIFSLLYSTPSSSLIACVPLLPRPLVLGALIGLSVWLRPDGVTLLAAAGWVILTDGRDWDEKLRAASLTLSGFAVLFLPYLGFNRALSDAWWPNTFYAKQAEYAIHRTIPFLTRLFEQASLPMVGVGILLLPAFLRFWARTGRRRAWASWAAPLWVVGYLVLYAWRLPVTYQHGRYLMPAMPIFFLWGLAGLADWNQARSAVVWRRVVSRVWVLSVGVGLFLFWGLGAAAYSRDVGVIESEMVATARWIAENTPPAALIAAHDIGALGYFGEREILDLAGLVSPQVMPIIRDEQALRTYLTAEGADYLMTFPGWYPLLVSCAPIIYQSRGEVSPSLGGENMAVYRWSSPQNCEVK